MGAGFPCCRTTSSPAFDEHGRLRSGWGDCRYAVELPLSCSSDRTTQVKPIEGECSHDRSLARTFVHTVQPTVL